ncbi:hydroxysqualene dehydroxylase HpnE [Candidatus Binatia bacterium]|nr:hydroxysqualene dehydroxylase HpnE [Candidatus Binatia bacterium]
MAQHVVVIGGGFAGLTAAVDLAERGYAVTVVEGRGRLGGRAFSFTDRQTGAVVDNGQHAMMGCYTHTFAFLDRIGASNKLVRQDNLRVEMRHADLGAGAIACSTLPGPLHMLSAIFGYRLLTRRERLRAALGGARLMRMRQARDPRLTTWTVADLLTALGQSPNARASFWYPLAIATLNEAPDRAVAAPLAEVLARAFFGSRRDSQFVLARVGLSDLYTEDARLFIETRGGTIVLNAAVDSLAPASDGKLAVLVRDGRRLDADAVVSAVPPRVLAGLLPAVLRDHPMYRGLDRFGSSPIVSTHLWFDRPVLDADFVGLVGTTTQWLFNRTALTGEGNHGGQYLSAVISAGHDLVDRDPDEIARIVVDDTRRVLPAARAAQVVRTVVVKEKHATISATPAVERLRPETPTPLDRFFLAGDWTRTGLPPVIEGAVASGYGAAAAVAARLRKP